MGGHFGEHRSKKASQLGSSDISPNTILRTDIGAALARDFIQAQWLRIHIGVDAKISGTEIDNWCPSNRLRFRLPPWWQGHDLVIEDDQTLSAIYGSFAAELAEIARSSDDPTLNRAIAQALEHLTTALPTSRTTIDTAATFETCSQNLTSPFFHKVSKI